MAFSRRGDAALVLAMGIGVLGVAVAAGIYLFGLSKNRSEKKLLSEESAFYAGELGIVSIFLKSNVNGTPLNNGTSSFQPPNTIGK